MKKQKNKRKNLLLIIWIICWGMFPTALQMAMRQRGQFAIGGEYCLLLLPFVIAELVFTIEDLLKGTTAE